MIDAHTIELVHAELDGELDDAGRAELGARLRESEEVRDYHAQMRELSAFIDRLPAHEVPEGLHRKIVDQVKLPAGGRTAWFNFGRVPGFLRYGLATAAGLLIAIGIYEYRPGQEGEPDFSSMAGTIMPGGNAAGAEVLDDFSFEIEQLSSSVSLQRRDGALVLDVLLDSNSPVDITVDFTSDGLEFDAIAQMQSDLSFIEIADRAIQLRSTGRQHFAVMLHRDEGLADSAAATIRFDYHIDGKLLNSGELTTK